MYPCIICICVYVEYVPKEARKQHQFPAAGVTGGCKITDVDAREGTWVLHKSKRILLNHQGISLATIVVFIQTGRMLVDLNIFPL